jgi:hypothetical protein
MNIQQAIAVFDAAEAGRWLWSKPTASAGRWNSHRSPRDAALCRESEQRRREAIGDIWSAIRRWTERSERTLRNPKMR